jgi:flagellin-specific chaperone FliS
MTLLNILTPYKYGNHEITDKDIHDWHNGITFATGIKRLMSIRDEVSSKLTFQVTGYTYDSLVRLYEYANYRIGLMVKNM